MNLSSRAFLGPDAGDFPHVTLDFLMQHSAGLICLTGGPAGVVNRLLASGQRPAAEGLLGDLASAFGDRLYVELQRHGLDVERQTEPPLVDLAYSLGLPLVAPN